MPIAMSCVAARRLSTVLLFASWLPAVAIAQPPAEPSLPLKRIVLYSSGVGYFEHRGSIEGDRAVTFQLKTADINDLLKSLVVQDQGGGLVTAVNYASPEPIGRTLRGFAIDLNGSPSLAQIYEQLRGSRVEVQGPSNLEGTIVGIESRTIAAGSTTLSVPVLNLRTEQGLESIRIDTIQRTRFLDPRVEREFQQALDLLAGARRADQQAVTLQFRGAGRREVAAGYLQESPVWKTSYRLILDDQKTPQIQGWAIVENVTGQPWRDVQLALVSGRPISFLMDLYEPLFSPRPLVAPVRHAGLRPRIYEQDLDQRSAQAAAIEAQALNDRRAGGTGGGTFGRGAGMAGMGGMGGGLGGGMGGGVAPAGRRAQRPFATALAAASGEAPIDPTQGVAAVASGEEVGELFRYALTSPVTLDRNQSAMLPIVEGDVKADKLAIYNPTAHGKHPLSGLRLTNSTEVHWMQGPITLFDSGEYAGEARIEDIPPGASRLISYALDLRTEIATENQNESTELIGLEVQAGGLKATSLTRREFHYVIRNSDLKPRKLLIERPIDAPWKPTTPDPVEKTRSLYRYAFEVPAGRTARLIIGEQKDSHEELALLATSAADIEVYLSSRVASQPLRKALEDVMQRKTALLEVERQRKEVERQIAEIAADQLRVRSNLQSVRNLHTGDPFAPPEARLSRELAQRYLSRLDAQETELDGLRSRLLELKDRETKSASDLEKHLQNLSVK